MFCCICERDMFGPEVSALVCIRQKSFKNVIILSVKLMYWKYIICTVAELSHTYKCSYKTKYQTDVDFFFC